MTYKRYFLAGPKSLRSAVSAAGVPFGVKMIAYPIVGTIFLGAIGSFFWLDAIYGVAVALAGPKLLVACSLECI
jgi:hypothetical protein